MMRDCRRPQVIRARRLFDSHAQRVDHKLPIIRLGHVLHRSGTVYVAVGQDEPHVRMERRRQVNRFDEFAAIARGWLSSRGEIFLMTPGVGRIRKYGLLGTKIPLGSAGQAGPLT
jgi:hypothetical protein